MTGPDRRGKVGQWDHQVVAHLEDWCEYLRAVEQRSAVTIDGYRRVVRRLGAEVARGRPWDPATLDRAQIEAFLRRLFHLGHGTSSISTAVTAVRGFCHYLRAHGIVERSPMDGVRGPRPYHQSIAVLTLEEVERLIWGDDLERKRLPLDLLACRTRVIVAVTYAGALRASEVGALRVDDLLWSEDGTRCSVLVREGKWARSDVRVPLPDWCVRVVSAWLGRRVEWPERIARAPQLFPAASSGEVGRRAGGERVLTRWTVARLFTERCAEVGLVARGRLRLSPHVLRHSRIQHLADAGMPVKRLSRFARHSSIAVTDRYLRATEQDVRRSIEKLEPLARRRRAASDPRIGPALRALTGELDALVSRD